MARFVRYILWALVIILFAVALVILLDTWGLIPKIVPVLEPKATVVVTNLVLTTVLICVTGASALIYVLLAIDNGRIIENAQAQLRVSREQLQLEYEPNVLLTATIQLEDTKRRVGFEVINLGRYPIYLASIEIEGQLFSDSDTARRPEAIMYPKVIVAPHTQRGVATQLLKFEDGKAPELSQRLERFLDSSEETPAHYRMPFDPLSSSEKIVLTYLYGSTGTAKWLTDFAITSSYCECEEIMRFYVNCKATDSRKTDERVLISIDTQAHLPGLHS